MPTDRRCVLFKEAKASRAVGITLRDFHQKATLMALMIEKIIGTTIVSQTGATDRCVAANAQVLDIKIKYMIGICLQNARYFAISRSEL